MDKTTNKFELLRSKNIIEILDGDKDFGEIESDISQKVIQISMPYLSGAGICEISTMFGFSASYGYNGNAKSRWQYFDDLLMNCISNNRMSDLLKFLFSKDRFEYKLKGCEVDEIENVHKELIKRIIEQINKILYFGSNELVVLNDNFYIKEIGKTVQIAAPKIKSIDRTYIKSISDRAMQDIDTGNYDSAITKSRTLLEEVFCYVIENKSVVPSDKGDVGKLYGQVKSLYNMHQNSQMDIRINTLLSGLEKILKAITEMRNEVSDSHGVGSRRINIDKHHARLFVNSALTMADFILSVGEKNY